MRTVNFFILCLLLGFAGAANAQIKLIQVASNLDRPVDIQDPRDGTNRLFFILQRGRIVIYNGSNVLSTPFLNISSLVTCCGEEGLLSLAFHPNYKSNGFFYVYYVNTSGNLVLARYKVSSKANVANANSRTILLTIPHPTFGNHNGGQIQFGRDGNLYLSVGDGGSGGDPPNNAQNLSKLLGKILRLNVNSGSPYSIPAGNPFINTAGARKEIWAYGVRNPWRISFDRANGNLYIGDVGQSKYEEISFLPASAKPGANFGWRRMEGKHCFNPTSNCNNGSLRVPIVEYSHDSGCSVTGGYVYRGSSIPSLVGTYLFSDFCSGIIWESKRNSTGQWITSKLLSSGGNVSSFGEDRNSELYVAHLNTGRIYRVAKQ